MGLGLRFHFPRATSTLSSPHALCAQADPLLHACPLLWAHALLPLPRVRFFPLPRVIFYKIVSFAQNLDRFIFFFFWPNSAIFSSVFKELRSVHRVFSCSGHVSNLNFLKNSLFIIVLIISQSSAMEKSKISRPISITLNEPNYIHWAQAMSDFLKAHTV